METKAFTAALLMVCVALAGCSDGEASDGSAFSVKTPSDPVTEPFVFTARVSADEYLWNFGDGRAGETGKTVEHVYGFQDGQVRVKLSTVKDGVTIQHTPKTLVLGTGENARPTFQMSVSQVWVQVGEPLTLSGAASTDPEGDPLLFSYFCKRESDIGPVGPSHSHGPGGIAYGGSGTDPVPVTVLNGTGVPSSDREVSGDFCTGMVGDGSFTENATLAGAFEQAGIYKITMLAKDPVAASTSGSVTVYVTDEPRQAPIEVIPLSGSLGTGRPADLDQLSCDENVDQCDHIADEPFELLYPILGFQAELVASEPDVTYAVYKGCTTDKTGEVSAATSEGAAWLEKGTHCIRTFNRATGADADYTVTLTIQYETDPSRLFEAPGH